MRAPGEDLPGDANRDGFVNAADAAILADKLAEDERRVHGAKATSIGDGKVDDLDATILAANWQAGSGASASVPEPSSVVLLLGVFALMAFCRRK